MSRNQRSSKGKGRARDADYAQSFASLTLSDWDPLARQSNYYDPSYTDGYGASYESPYAGDDTYMLTAQSTRTPTQSSSVAYGGAAGYVSSYPTTSATSSTGGYEYQSELSGTSSYSDYVGYDTASVDSSSVPAYGKGSVTSSGWHDTHSVSTAASPAPSSQGKRTDFNNTIPSPTRSRDNHRTHVDNHSHRRDHHRMSSSEVVRQHPQRRLAEHSKDDQNHPFMRFKDLAVAGTLKVLHAITRDSGGESNHAPTQDKGKGKEPARGKRAWTDRSELSNNNTDSSVPSSSRARVSSSKRRRTSDRQLTFACPYNKKDPMSHRGCYKYKLSRIRDVKQHLTRRHRNPLYCPRCMGTFETEQERDEHIREFSCPLRQTIRLDGITESQRVQLAKKSPSNVSPEAQWFAIFDLLFPGHQPRPQSPYIDSELLQDITLYQDFMRSRGPRILTMFLAQRGAITWNTPNQERDLEAFQQTVLEEGLSIIFEQWLARPSSSNQDQDAASSSGSTGQDTPPSSSHSRERVGSTSMLDSVTVPHHSMESLPVEGPGDAPPESEDMPETSSDQVSLDGGLSEIFDFEHGDLDFLSDDDVMRLMMDDAPGSSELQPFLDGTTNSET